MCVILSPSYPQTGHIAMIDDKVIIEPQSARKSRSVDDNSDWENIGPDDDDDVSDSRGGVIMLIVKLNLSDS